MELTGSLKRKNRKTETCPNILFQRLVLQSINQVYAIECCFNIVSFFWNSSFSSGHKELIQSLTWDGTGSRLLSADLVGVCKLWVMKVNNNALSRPAIMALFKNDVCLTRTPFWSNELESCCPWLFPGAFILLLLWN